MSVRKNEEKGIFLVLLKSSGNTQELSGAKFHISKDIDSISQTMKVVLIQFFTYVNFVLHTALVYFPLLPNPIVFSVFKAMESDCLYIASFLCF